MNWAAISGVADVLASVGVIVSLIYVAIQLKLNSRTIGTANYQQNMALISDVSGLISSDPDLSDIYMRGTQCFRDLNENEKVRFHMLMTKFILPIQINIHLKDRGLMDDKLYSGQVQSFLNMFENPGIREWWLHSTKWFHQDFVDYMNIMIERRYA
jgi:hypothetical protein